MKWIRLESFISRKKRGPEEPAGDGIREAGEVGEREVVGGPSVAEITAEAAEVAMQEEKYSKGRVVAGSRV